MAPYRIIKQGYMLKEPPPAKRGLRKKLHRYWFVLVEDKHQLALVYFKNEDSYLARQRNEGFIRIDDSEAVSVIGEYLNSKNAFSITTPKHKYILVPESRYDLHEWIFTLHHSLEHFQKKREKMKETRQRTSSTSSTGGATGKTTPTTRQRASSTSSPGGATGKATPTPPTRRAPPPPVAVKPGSSPRRKPVRPAPAAPGKKKETEEFNIGPSPVPYHESPTPELTTPTFFSQDAMTSLELGRDVIMDLDITQTDEDILQQLPEAESEPPEAESDRPLEDHPQLSPPAHFRSASDSLVHMHVTTHSMPELNEHENTESPEELPVIKKTPETSPKISHTRHLSLIVGNEGHHKRKSSKRTGSLKRSRSPPNLPPPPPPPEPYTGESSGSEPGAEVKQESLSVESIPVKTMKPNVSNTSLGFSEVMNTISNIDQQLDELSMTPPKPTVLPPKRETPGYVGFSTFKPIDIPVPEYPEEEEEEQIDFSCLDMEDDRQSGSEDTEVHLDAQETSGSVSVQTASKPEEDIVLERTTPEGGYGSENVLQSHPNGDIESELVDKNISPTNVLDKQVTSRIILTNGAPYDNSTSDSGRLVTGQKPPKSSHKQHRVMFKEEVEDIPSYEPRVDEEVPSTVAELKKMLFGGHETVNAKYKVGEGPLSPRYPSSGSFDDHFRDSCLSPNINNNNSEPGGYTASGTPPLDEEDETENLYDTPWDKKPESKYVSRIRDRASPPNKGKLHFGAVSTHETPKPKNFEVRNVHSLERPPRKDRYRCTDDNSLLESISNTLQVSSKYGSDSLLTRTTSPPDRTVTTSATATSNFDPVREISPSKEEPHSQKSPSKSYSPPQKREVRSTRGELEKIRAEHRRDPRYSPQASPKFGLHRREMEASGRRVGFTSRLSSSWDQLERDPNTRIMYNLTNNSHTFRSLV